MRINHRDPGAGGQVGCGHVREQRTFAGTGAAEQGHVLPACLGRHAELGFAEKIICMGADGSGLEHAGGLCIVQVGSKIGNCG